MLNNKKKKRKKTKNRQNMKCFCFASRNIFCSRKKKQHENLHIMDFFGWRSLCNVPQCVAWNTIQIFHTHAERKLFLFLFLGYVILKTSYLFLYPLCIPKTVYNWFFFYLCRSTFECVLWRIFVSKEKGSPKWIGL